MLKEKVHYIDFSFYECIILDIVLIAVKCQIVSLSKDAMIIYGILR